MTLILAKLGEDVHHERILVRNGQSITVGKGHASDLWCQGDDTLGDVHFSVETLPTGPRVRNISPHVGSLSVNGAQVVEAILRDGDIIQAGRSRFQVAIVGGPVAIDKPVVPGVPQVSHTEKMPLRVNRVSGLSRVVQLKIQEGQKYLPDIVKLLSKNRQLHLLVNCKAGKVPLPAGAKDEDDLFHKAPPEIRSAQSLHLASVTDASAAVASLRPLLSKDAAVLLITDQSREQLLESHKLYWAWFHSPSALSAQLAHGSAELAGKLLHGIYAALVPHADNAAISLFVPEDYAVTVHAELANVRV